MIKWLVTSVVLAVGLIALPGIVPVAGGAEIAVHRALYSMSLGSTRNDSGVVDAHGAMAYEWGETCDGWTVEQRYKLRMQYAGDGPRDNEVEITSRELLRNLSPSFVDTGVSLMTDDQALRQQGYGVTLGETASYWKAHRPHASRVYTNRDVERLHGG